MDAVIGTLLYFETLVLLHKHPATQLTWDYAKPNHFKLIIFASVSVSSFTEQELFMNNLSVSSILAEQCRKQRSKDRGGSWETVVSDTLCV